MKKSVFQEKEDTYIALEKIIAEIARNPYKIYYSDFYNEYRGIRSRINLYGSDKVIAVLSQFNSKISMIHDEYQEKFYSEGALIERDNLLSGGEVTEFELDQDKERYMENKALPVSEVRAVYDELIKQIRSELKTDK